MRPLPASSIVKVPARGSRSPDRPHMSRIVVAFDNSEFDRINMFAATRRISFAEAVRTLVEWGFEAEVQP